jgi:hypothetical protein
VGQTRSLPLAPTSAVLGALLPWSTRPGVDARNLADSLGTTNDPPAVTAPIRNVHEMVAVLPPPPTSVVVTVNGPVEVYVFVIVKVCPNRGWRRLWGYSAVETRGDTDDPVPERPTS